LKPWSLGINLQEIDIYTGNFEWENDHVIDSVISRKCIEIKGFCIFLNDEEYFKEGNPHLVKD
jgi:hypothetical protein